MTTTCINVDRWTDIDVCPLTYKDKDEIVRQVIQVDTQIGRDERTIAELTIEKAEELIEALKLAIAEAKARQHV